MTTHRRHVRPRYGRIVALACSSTVVLVAALGGLGVLTTSSASAGRPPERTAYAEDSSSSATTAPPAQEPTQRPTPTQQATQQSTRQPTGATATSGTTGSPQSDGTAPAVLPAASGSGRRIVFSQGEQRVWLVDARDHVQRTYLVSGSLYPNLQPGTYSVYSRSRWATGVDNSGVMQYFVRFTQGPTGAAIGFHSIPTKDGHPVQTVAQLGTPESHGCVRQWLPDAIALWNFAPVGTKVDVVA